MNTKRDKVAAAIGIIVTAVVVGYLQVWPILACMAQDMAG